MASKTIGTVLSLKDKFSSTVNKTSKNTRKFKNQLNHTTNSVKAFKKSATSSFTAVAKKAIALGGAYMGIRAGINLGKESAELAKQQIEAETKLQAVLKNTPKMSEKAYKNLVKYTGAQQKVGVIGDEVQIAGLQQLATYQLQEKTLKKLIPGMNDLVAQQKGLNATQGDAVNVGNMVGKVMSGQLGALSRAGIIFSKAQGEILKYGTEQEKAATLAKVLQQNVGGVNKELANQDIGKIQQAKNILADYKEELGNKILPLQAKFAGWFVTKMPKIIGFIKNLGSKAKYVFDTTKNYGGIAIGFVKDNFVTLKKWGVDTWDKIKQKIEEHKPAVEGVKGILSDIVGVAINLKDRLVDAFEQAKPTIEWLKDNALPAVTDALLSVVEAGTGVYNFIKDNWSAIEPIVYGVVGAFTAYKLIMLGVTAVTTAWNVVAGIGTAVTTAFGVAIGFITSPIGIVVAAIGALIAIGVLVWKNWDTIKAKASELGEGIKNALAPIGEFFSNLFNGAKESAKGGINFIIRAINSMTSGLNKVKFDIPDWVPVIGGKEFGINIPQIPEFAMGTQYFKGGIARTDERGGEIKQYPNGTKIYPHDKSVQMAREEGRNEGNGLNLTLIVQGNIIGNEDYANYLGNTILNKIKMAQAIIV